METEQLYQSQLYYLAQNHFTEKQKTKDMTHTNGQIFIELLGYQEMAVNHMRH